MTKKYDPPKDGVAYGEVNDLGGIVGKLWIVSEQTANELISQVQQISEAQIALSRLVSGLQKLVGKAISESRHLCHETAIQNQLINQRLTQLEAKIYENS